VTRPSPAPALAWDGGVPRSTQFDDLYYSRSGGLAEARAVFLAGCDLPAAWADSEAFVVGELGFGSGLNVAALLDLWRRTRPPGGRLHIFSVEAFPLAPGDAQRALAAWPEIRDPAAALLGGWPRRARGFHRIVFAALGAVLDVAVMDVEDALDAWTGFADAWFLDGFSPSRNPAMWTDRVLGAVAHRSTEGARLATFTVSGAVRRGLEAHGFLVERKPGFGAKRERLQARLSRPAAPPRRRRPASAAIVGAGIAGASLTRALRALGLDPLVIEADAAGAGASGNSAALVMPRLDAGAGPIGALYAQALARAADLLAETPGAIIARGVRQLEVGQKDAGRFDRVATSPLFEPGAVERLAAKALSESLGEPVSVGGLFLRDACVIEPTVVLADWLAGAERLRAGVHAIERAGAAWSLRDAAGAEIATAELVFVANGPAAARLVPGVPLAPLRGQVSFAAVDAPPPMIAASYAIPTRDCVLVGATHDRGDTSVEVRAQDHRRNLERLATSAPALARRLEAASLRGRASVRAVTPDFMPLAGEAEAEGLFILAGLGSRGFCTAPLLAEHLASLALGAPSPLPAALADIVRPERFAMRRKRRLARSGGVQARSP
jgi:tRNA 5-methylaminomethyl-2-thiouridine biosynthesis bifunctional protein